MFPLFTVFDNNSKQRKKRYFQFFEDWLQDRFVLGFYRPL